MPSRSILHAPHRPKFRAPLTLILTDLLATTLTPAPPSPRSVEPTAASQTPFKLSYTRLTAANTTVTPRPFLTHDGQHRTELVVRFTHLQVQDLCFSLRKNHRGTIDTVRIRMPELRATDLTVALDSLDGLDVLGQQLSLRSLTQITDTPLSQPRHPGFLPIQLSDGLLNIGGTFRWVNTHGFQVQHLNVHNSPHQPECY